MKFTPTPMLGGMLGFTAGICHASHAAAAEGSLLPPAGSVQARGVDDVFSLLLVLSVVLFLVVLCAMLIFAVRYRRRNDYEMAPRAAAFCPPWVIAWGVVSALIVAVIFIIGERSYTDLTTSPRYAYEVFVTASDAEWTFEHPNGKIQDDGQLFIPADRPVRFVLTTADISYAMMMPDFRLNQGFVPGHEASLWFQAGPGQYTLQGGEYCGPKYGSMHAKMTAYPTEDFQASLDTIKFWLDRYANDELHKAGYQLYANCKACHSLDGSRLVGPSFQETSRLWGKERTLADGRTVVVDEDYIRKSVLTPSVDIVGGFKDEMTPFAGQFRDREMAALIEFIKRLDEVVDAKGNVIAAEADSQ